MSTNIEHTPEEWAKMKAEAEAERRHCEDAARELVKRKQADGHPIDIADLTELLYAERAEAVTQKLFDVIEEGNALVDAMRAVVAKGHRPDCDRALCEVDGCTRCECDCGYTLCAAALAKVPHR